MRCSSTWRARRPIGHALRESHLTVAPRVDRSLRVVSIALKFSNYALSPIIERFISSASVEPFLEHHKEAPTAVQVRIAKRGNFRRTDLVSEDLKGVGGTLSCMTLRWFLCIDNSQMVHCSRNGRMRWTRHHHRASEEGFLQALSGDGRRLPHNCHVTFPST